jgi:cysteine sulfinate desulfinase/cysteine desulfurase-like protein
MGLSESEAHCAVRLTLGRRNTAKEIDRVLKAMGEILSDDQAAVRFVPCR